MKKVFVVLVILLMCAGCSQTKEEINVLNWSSYIPGSVIRNFENETGIKVNYSTYSSNEELLAKISSASAGTYDLIFPSDYMVEIMVKRDLLEQLDTSKLNNFNNLNSNYLNLDYDRGNIYTVPFIAASTVIAVNRDKVGDLITSYNDLLNSNYKNDIVLIDDQRIIIGIALLANGFDMNSVNENELEIAKNWLLQLKPNIKAYDSDSPKNFLITGEASIGVLWNAEAALAVEKNPNIQTVFPREGFALSIDNFAIPKDAKNKDLVYSFIDYILRTDVMKEIINSYPYKNINDMTNRILDASYLNNSAANIPDSIIRQGKFVKNIGENIKMYDKLWAEIK